MDSRKLTCVINVKNGEKYIRHTIESTLCQTEKIKILVVDNHSHDGTLEVCREFPELEIVKTPAPMTLGEARNFSLSCISTEYVAWLDSDDTWSENFAHVVTNTLDNDQNLAMCCTNYNIIDEHGFLTKSKMVLDQSGKTEDDPKSIIKRRGFASAWPTYCFRLKYIKIAGGFDTKLKYAPDLDLILRISNYGAGIFINEPLVNYRMHNSQLTRHLSHRLKNKENQEILINFIIKNKMVWIYKIPSILIRTWYLIARGELRLKKTPLNYLSLCLAASLPPNNIMILNRLRDCRKKKSIKSMVT